MQDTLDLVAGAARARLLPALGGAIAHFTWRGRPVLRPTSAAAIAERNVRLTACYPLVPYSNRIRDAHVSFGGETRALARNFGDHPHAIHGVGWQRGWNIRAASPSSATLAFAHEAHGDDAAAWPWRFAATQSFDLCVRGDEEALLVVTLTLANTADTPFPFGLGWHPFFPRDESTTLAFDAQDVWLNDATQLPQQRVAAADRWSFRAPRTPGGETIDNVFCGWRGTATIASAERKTVTTIAADSACSRLVVYAPAGQDFMAAEPVTHETDAFNRAAAGAAGTGLRVLPPGAAFSCTMRIGIAPHA